MWPTKHIQVKRIDNLQRTPFYIGAISDVARTALSCESTLRELPIDHGPLPKNYPRHPNGEACRKSDTTETMGRWAKLVTDDGETIYVNPTTGKYMAEADQLSIENWGEYSSLTKT